MLESLREAGQGAPLSPDFALCGKSTRAAPSRGPPFGVDFILTKGRFGIVDVIQQHSLLQGVAALTTVITMDSDINSEKHATSMKKISFIPLYMWGPRNEEICAKSHSLQIT